MPPIRCGICDHQKVRVSMHPQKTGCEMPRDAAFHPGLYFLPKYLFACIQNEMGKWLNNACLQRLQQLLR